MRRTILLSLIICIGAAAPAVAAPGFNMVPLGLQSGNWVWRLDLSADVALAGTSTPLAAELGFRLTGSPLLSVTNINPAEFSPPNPGNFIFGWETPDPSANNKPVGLQMNLSTNEVFAAFGSDDFPTSAFHPFLQFVAKGPLNGGSTTSTIEWLGAYGGKGRIAQLVGPTSAQNFDIYSGTATQIPEPATIALLGICAVGLFQRRRHSIRNC